MVYNLSDQQSLITQWISEIRDIDIQKDRMRFRRNLERIGEVAAYELSKQLPFIEKVVQTPLGESTIHVLEQEPVLTTILRAGIPLQQGILLKLF
jgi:uracil phosphoribosyltransferase